MTLTKKLPAEYIYVSIPKEYLKIYTHLLILMSEYGEEMLDDCNASCTNKNLEVIKCFNMFNAAIAAKELGKTKLAETLIKYIEATLNQKYKIIKYPDIINLPLEENGAVVIVDFSNPPRFEVLYEDSIPIGETLNLSGAEVYVEDETLIINTNVNKNEN